MPVQRLRAEAQEADQRVLSHLQEAHQGRHQDVPAVMGGGRGSRYCIFRAVVPSASVWVGFDNLSGHEPNSGMMVPIFFFYNVSCGGGKGKRLPADDSSCTETANTSSFILTREIRGGLCASILSMWCLFLMSRVFAELPAEGGTEGGASHVHLLCFPSLCCLISELCFCQV